MLNFESNVINLTVLFARLSVCRHHTPAYPEKKRQSYVVLNEFEWNGLNVSEVINF